MSECSLAPPKPVFLSFEKGHVQTCWLDAVGYLVFHEEDPVLGILSASKIERKTPEVRKVAAPGSMLV
jgi:hypothetical protein